jgi:hypothetical protein
MIQLIENICKKRAREKASKADWKAGWRRGRGKGGLGALHG